MKNLTKIIFPFVFSSFLFLNLNDSNNDTKKEYYQKTIRKFFPKIDNIKYEKDIEIHKVKDYWQTPEETEKLGSGDCEDKAIYLYSLLLKKRIDVGFVVGKLNKKEKNCHIWMEYIIGNKEFIIESSENSRIIEKNKINTKERYLIYCLRKNWLYKIKKFETRSGIKLKFKNKIRN